MHVPRRNKTTSYTFLAKCKAMEALTPLAFLFRERRIFWTFPTHSAPHPKWLPFCGSKHFHRQMKGSLRKRSMVRCIALYCSRSNILNPFQLVYSNVLTFASLYYLKIPAPTKKYRERAAHVHVATNCEECTFRFRVPRVSLDSMRWIIVKWTRSHPALSRLLNEDFAPTSALLIVWWKTAAGDKISATFGARALRGCWWKVSSVAHWCFALFKLISLISRNSYDFLSQVFLKRYLWNASITILQVFHGSCTDYSTSMITEHFFSYGFWGKGRATRNFGHLWELWNLNCGVGLSKTKSDKRRFWVSEPL